MNLLLLTSTGAPALLLSLYCAPIARKALLNAARGCAEFVAEASAGVGAYFGGRDMLGSSLESSELLQGWHDISGTPA